MAAKPAARQVPLWSLLVASELLDLLSFGFAAAGIEDFGISSTDSVQGVQILAPGTIHWSHGLFMSIIWSAIAAGIVYRIYRDRRVSSVVGLVVFSHWVLDFIVHLPDLPLFFAGSPKVGLGLWGSGTGLIISGVLEVLLLLGGLVIYLHAKGSFARIQALFKA